MIGPPAGVRVYLAAGITDKRTGDERYAAEELVAELASAILGNELGLLVDHLADHASYIANWLRILKADLKALLTIASKADEAANYLLRLGGHEPLLDEAEAFEAGANDPKLPAAPASIAACRAHQASGGHQSSGQISSGKYPSSNSGGGRFGVFCFGGGRIGGSPVKLTRISAPPSVTPWKTAQTSLPSRILAPIQLQRSALR